jgi:hypothetical protein
MVVHRSLIQAQAQEVSRATHVWQAGSGMTWRNHMAQPHGTFSTKGAGAIARCLAGEDGAGSPGQQQT